MLLEKEVFTVGSFSSLVRTAIKLKPMPWQICIPTPLDRVPHRRDRVRNSAEKKRGRNSNCLKNIFNGRKKYDLLSGEIKH